MAPIFPCVGGKGRLRKWIASFMPPRIDRYVEPFAGKGNMLFYVASVKDVGSVLCNDAHQVRFWESIIDGEVSDSVLDCFCTYGAKGGKRIKCSISPEAITKRVADARQIMCDKDIKCTYMDWVSVMENVSRKDVVYLDPPYLNTETPYPNIDHVSLADRVLRCEATWFLSGYMSPFYKDRFGDPIATRDIQMPLSGGKQRRIECVWSNMAVRAK